MEWWRFFCCFFCYVLFCFLLGFLFLFLFPPCWLLSLPWPVFYGEGSWAGSWAAQACWAQRVWGAERGQTMAGTWWGKSLPAAVSSHAGGPLLSKPAASWVSFPLWEPRDLSLPLTQQLQGVETFYRQWQTKELLRTGKKRKGTGRWRIYLLVILGRMLLCQV